MTRDSRLKLTDDQVRDIRRRLAPKERQADLAREYGIHQTTVSQIMRRTQYQWVEDEPSEVTSEILRARVEGGQ